MELGQRSQRGYAMAALLVGLSVMAVLSSAAMPVWTQYNRREREQELIWRGEQYARAVGLFQRKFANTFPPNVDILIEQRFLRKKYKDPITNDEFQLVPAGGMMPGAILPPSGAGGSQQSQQGAGLNTAQQPRSAQQQRPSSTTQQSPSAFGLQNPSLQSGPAQGSIGIQGVVSKSKDASIKIYNGRNKYNEWTFVYLASAQRLGGAGVQAPGVPPGSSQTPGANPRGGSPFNPGGIDRRPSLPAGGQGGGTPQSPRQPSPFGPSRPPA